MPTLHRYGLHKQDVEQKQPVHGFQLCSGNHCTREIDESDVFGGRTDGYAPKLTKDLEARLVLKLDATCA